MIDTLARMHPALRHDTSLALRQAKNFERRFVRAGLRCGGDVIKFNFERGRGRAEQIVVDIGENAQLEL
jgi:hypothetical protein